MLLKALKFNVLLLFLLSSNLIFSKISLSRDTFFHAKSGWLRDSRVVSLGVGFVNFDLNRMTALRNTRNYSISALRISTPFYAKLEFFLSKHLGMGVTANYNSVDYYYNYSVIRNNQTITDRASVLYEIFGLNVRVNYHIFYGKKIDVYVGGGSGLRMAKTSTSRAGIRDLLPNGFLREYEGTLGIRYHFKNLGLYAETGFVRSLFQAGICYNIDR